MKTRNRWFVLGLTWLCLLAGLPNWAALAAEQRVFLSSPSELQRQTDAVAWSNFYPTGWVNTATLSAGVTAASADGFIAATTQYRMSTDGGATWSAWGNAELSTAQPDPNTLHITLSDLSLPDSNGGNRLQFQVTTAQSQTEVSSAYAVQVDTVAPGPPVGMMSFPDVWTNVNSFRETWTNPSDTSGIVGAYYRLNSEPLHPTNGTFVATTHSIDGIHVPAEGAHAMLVWLVDAAGNVSHLNYRVDLEAFRYDATMPTVGIVNQGPLGSNGWYTGTVSMQFSPSDLVSGLASWSWQLDGAAPSSVSPAQISANGLHSVVVRARDNADNVMSPITRTVDIDAEPPALGYRLTPSPSASGWFTAPISASFAVTDTLSGAERVYWQVNSGMVNTGNVVFLGQDGIYSLRAYGRDRAGNRSAPTALTLRLDTSPPTTTLLTSPSAPQASGFYTQPVSLTFQANDIPPISPPVVGSGVGGMRMRFNTGPWQAAQSTTLTTSGVYQLSYYSFDMAGNVEPSHSRTFAVDLDIPSPIAPSVTPVGWAASNVFTLNWQNPADASGVIGAWVWIGQGPPVPAAAVFYPQTTSSIAGLTVPAEGEWAVWMALADRAGHRGPFVHMGTVRYDATPPQLQVQINGPQGQNGWYIGPVQVALSLIDAGSGAQRLRYRVDGAPWQQVAQSAAFTLSAAGRHILDYYGEDRAGYVAGPEMVAVRIDADPPAAPIAVQITPTQWSNANSWLLTWRNPVDVSGVAMARWDWQTPATATSGQSAPAATQAITLTAPAEGSHPLYLWLQDTAGNASLSQGVTLRDAVRYDATAPEITMQLIPAPNAAGWVRGAVAVTLEASDSLSGVRSLAWQLDGGSWNTGASFTVNGDGAHTLVVRSVDWAGNLREESKVVRIDSLAPVASLRSLPTYQSAVEIQVQWDGADVTTTDANGMEYEVAGLANFDVQVRHGANGAWQTWRSGVSVVQDTYIGQRGHVYSFRARSVDLAGNVSAWSTAAGHNTILIDPVENGAFSTQNFTAWSTNSTLGLSLIQEAELFPGHAVPAARLGTPVWEACSDPGNIPTLQCGDSWSSISQQITVPAAADVPKPVLEFWYRVQTYDQISTTSAIWNTLCPQDPPPALRWVDSFDVTVRTSGATEPVVLLRAGNTLPQFPEPIEFRDLKWQRAEIDLSAYAGQTLVLELSSHNRLDSRFNTWTDVYGVRVRSGYNRVYLPLAGIAMTPPVQELQVCWPNRHEQTALPAEATEEIVR